MYAYICTRVRVCIHECFTVILYRNSPYDRCYKKNSMIVVGWGQEERVFTLLLSVMPNYICMTRMTCSSS
jgi:hypothetical protein